jgi:DNA topoisomerase IB
MIDVCDGRQLERSDISAPGIRRIRCGRGFRYLDAGAGQPDPRTLARIKALVIPPAWQDVWICPNPNGHIQAMGTDSAGRRQYLYHELWRTRRDAGKHDRILGFAIALPGLRQTVDDHLRGRGLSRERVLATTVRLIDLGFFRPGGEEYADENGTFGLATLRREHVRVVKDEINFDYVAKGSKQRTVCIIDQQAAAVLRALKRRRGADDRLFAYWHARRWHQVTATEINEYLQQLAGADYTVKDFRTWHATVLAAVGLAVSTEAESAAARKRAVSRTASEVADYLGNTPAVARASYIDPRVVELYQHGVTVARVLSRLAQDSEFGQLATAGDAEQAVLRMLKSAAALENHD